MNKENKLLFLPLGCKVNKVYRFISLFFKSKERRQYTTYQNLKHALLLPLLLNKLGKDIPDDVEPFIEYSFNMFVLSTLAFIFLMNVFGYLISFTIIEKYQLNVKYPKLQRIVNFYIKSSFVFIVIEGIIGISILLFIIISNAYYCGVLINKFW